MRVASCIVCADTQRNSPADLAKSSLSAAESSRDILGAILEPPVCSAGDDSSPFCGERVKYLCDDSEQSLVWLCAVQHCEHYSRSSSCFTWERVVIFAACPSSVQSEDVVAVWRGGGSSRLYKFAVRRFTCCFKSSFSLKKCQKFRRTGFLLSCCPHKASLYCRESVRKGMRRVRVQRTYTVGVMPGVNQGQQQCVRKDPGVKWYPQRLGTSIL